LTCTTPSFVARAAAWASAALLLAVAPAAIGEEEHHLRGSSPLEAEVGKIVTVPGATDPHGAPDQCIECHGFVPVPGMETPVPSRDVCEACHPQTNFHLVGVPPEAVPVPDVFTLLDGQVDCITCHDEPACDGLPRRGRGEDHFRDGPYPTTLDLCFRCHERSTYRQTDPHRELRTKTGQRNDAVCVFCHQGVPESELDQVVEIIRVDPVELCKGCHAHQIHVGIPSHLVIAPEEMVARVGDYNDSEEYDIPLGPRGEVTCTTCHDPHPGLEPLPVDTTPRRMDKLRDSNRRYRDEYYLPRLRQELATVVDFEGNPLDLGDGPRNKDGLLRVPAEDGTLCLICHDLGVSDR